MRAELELLGPGGRGSVQGKGQLEPVQGPQPVPAEDRAHRHHRHLKGARHLRGQGEAGRAQRAGRPRPNSAVAVRPDLPVHAVQTVFCCPA